MGSRRTVSILPLVLVGLAAAAGCDDWVNDFTGPIDTISDEQVDTEAGLRLVTRGVEFRFNTAINSLVFLASALSDELRYDPRRFASNTFKQFDDGDIPLSSGIPQNVVYPRLTEMRFLADDVVRRAESLPTVSEAVRDSARFVGHLYGGVARYVFAVYYGIEPSRGGGVIDGGPFIPSAEMYDRAESGLEAALPLAPTAYDTRLVHSLLARIALYSEEYAAAGEHAAMGLQEDDPPFQAVNNDFVSWYMSFYTNNFPFYAVGERFVDYVEEHPAESERIPLAEVESDEGVLLVQAKYVEIDDPIPFMTWQETALIRAEVLLRAGQEGLALDRVNGVRAASGLEPLGSLDLDGLIRERDKELFLTGARLVDQRRFDQWHLGPNAWRYIPIPATERDSNPNL